MCCVIEQMMHFFQILQVVGNRVKWKVSTVLEGAIKDLLNEIITKTPLPAPNFGPTPSDMEKVGYAVAKMFC